MRRPILNVKTDVQQQTKWNVRMETKSETTVQLQGMALDKRLRQKRSSAYMEAVKNLDAGGVTCSQAKMDQLKQVISSEFPDLQPYQMPTGIIAKCYLGRPYEVHTLDMKLDILSHYKKGESLPQFMDRGRRLAMNPNYEYIEIYSDTLRAVTGNGDVSVIKG
ncbi:hypothetical protein [Rossellomorea marisflavi]|uniref:hypothetical protein n=1 Tax=Rossellomorea marisflavi TaxID=189381 RepID=UPI0035117BE2